MTYYGARDLAESFRTVRRNTIQVAEDIPEEKYGHKASPDTMSVGEMLAHLAASTHWAEQAHLVEKKDFLGFDDFGRYMAEGKQITEGLTTKADIIAALTSRGEHFAAQLESMTDAELAQQVRFPEPLQPPGKTRFEMLLSVKEHEMHHRGQLMLMERMLGIVPHLTRRRQSQ